MRAVHWRVVSTQMGSHAFSTLMPSIMSMNWFTRMAAGTIVISRTERWERHRLRQVAGWWPLPSQMGRYASTTSPPVMSGNWRTRMANGVLTMSRKVRRHLIPQRIAHWQAFLSQVGSHASAILIPVIMSMNWRTRMVNGALAISRKGPGQFRLCKVANWQALLYQMGSHASTMPVPMGVTMMSMNWSTRMVSGVLAI